MLPDAKAAKVVDGGREQDEDDKLRLPAHIKIIAGNEEQVFPKPEWQGVIEQKNAGEEKKKTERVK